MTKFFVPPEGFHPPYRLPTTKTATKTTAKHADLSKSHDFSPFPAQTTMTRKDHHNVLDLPDSATPNIKFIGSSKTKRRHSLIKPELRDFITKQVKKTKTPTPTRFIGRVGKQVNPLQKQDNKLKQHHPYGDNDAIGWPAFDKKKIEGSEKVTKNENEVVQQDSDYFFMPEEEAEMEFTAPGFDLKKEKIEPTFVVPAASIPRFPSHFSNAKRNIIPFVPPPNNFGYRFRGPLQRRFYGKTLDDLTRSIVHVACPDCKINSIHRVEDKCRGGICQTEYKVYRKVLNL